MDLVGPLPKGKGQCKFAIVAIDYFTKWVEVGALAQITKRNTTKFVWKSLVCLFGVPRVIIIDNGNNLTIRSLGPSQKSWIIDDKCKVIIGLQTPYG